MSMLGKDFKDTVYLKGGESVLIETVSMDQAAVLREKIVSGEKFIKIGDDSEPPAPSKTFKYALAAQMINPNFYYQGLQVVATAELIGLDNPEKASAYIYVKEELRGLGLGAELMKLLLGQLKAMNVQNIKTLFDKSSDLDAAGDISLGDYSVEPTGNGEFLIKTTQL
ncbi:MAG: GNAT family N-acetyltransferase [Bacteriovoracaceae bacterium]|nr:GNAT family N-acetyltransferase [Bacteriovoracaceae bacterium]